MRKYISQSAAAEDLAPIVPAIRWALTFGIESALEQYDPTLGHNQWILGSLAYNQILDRFERVFSTGNYRAPSDTSIILPTADVLEGLPEVATDLMPRIQPGLVRKVHVNQTPCFRFGPYLLFTQSIGTKPLNDFSWAALRRKTKQDIARLPYDSTAETGQLALDLDCDLLPRSNFVIISYRFSSSGFEAGYGLARDNSSGGSPWYWLSELAPFTSPAAHQRAEQSEGGTPRINKNVSLKRRETNTGGVEQG